MPIIDSPILGSTCRNCGCKRTVDRTSGERCQHCGSHTGSHSIGSFSTPSVQSGSGRLERRKSINAGIRRIYNAMLKAGSLKNWVRR